MRFVEHMGRENTFSSGFAVFLALAVIVPFLNYHRVDPSPTFYSELAAAVFFLLATAVGASLLPRRVALDPVLAVFCIGLLSVLAFQVASGRYYEFAMSWSFWAAFLCLFFLVVSFGQAASADPAARTLVVERLTAALLLAALFNSFAQVAQVTEWALQIRPIVFLPTEDLYDGYRCAPAGNVAQRNHANALAWLGIIGLVHATLQRRVRIPFAIVGFGLLLFSSALSSSRMAWLMAVCLAWLFYVGRGGLGWSGRRALAAGAGLVIALLAATLAREILLSGCTSSLDRALGGLGQTGSRPADYWIRVEMVRQALAIWVGQPLLGVGVGKFMAKTFSVESNLDVVQPLDFYPHNVALEILVSFGAVGGVLFLLATFVWIVRAWRNRNSSAQQWAVLAGLLVIGVPAFFELSLWYLYFLLPFGLMLGIAAPPAEASAPGRRLPLRYLYPFAAVAFLPLILFAVRDHMAAEHVTWLSKVARTPSEIAGPAAAAIPQATERLTLFAVWGEHEAQRFGQESWADLPSQLAANGRLMENIPAPHIVARQAMLEAMSGNTQKAHDLARRMMVFFPEHREALVQELRRRAAARGGEARELLRILDEESARPPRARGRS